MALTIDRLVPSKNALTRTIMTAPVLSCSVPMRAEAVPATGPWFSSARTAVEGITKPRQPNDTNSRPQRMKALSTPAAVSPNRRLVRALRTAWPTDDPGLTRAERLHLQKLLIANGYEIGEPDGKIGPVTRAAIAEAEKRFGMQPTGRAGRKIYRALGGG